MVDEAPLGEGEVVLLWGERGDRPLVRLRRGPQTVGSGVVDLASAIGAAPGVRLPWAGGTVTVLRPTLADRLRALRRQAQIVTPKDAMPLLFLAGVAPGQRVAEAGAGSGALTTVLAHFVGPAGRVVTHDRRADFLAVARRNVETAGLADRVEFRERDVAAEGFGAGGYDAVLLDLPEPWGVAAAARDALVPGGGIATYTPTYNQLERTVRELRAAGFAEVRSVEVLERALHVGEGGTRPEFEMLGHTGFLTGARKVGGPW